MTTTPSDPFAQADIAIEYFTDPLCCWSWAFEHPWRQLRADLGTRLIWRYRMGGLLANWDHYEDPVNSISRPAQMAPQWYEVRQLTGAELDERIWLEDPPSSSYPACLAYKAAELQSPQAGERMLAQLREAVMLQRRNFARWDVLQELAEELAAKNPGSFDAGRFADDLDGEAAAAAFRDDLMQTRYRQIGRFPALVVSTREGRSALLVGYRPYAVLRETLEQFASHSNGSARVSY